MGRPAAWSLLVDRVNAALAAHHASAFVPQLGGLERVDDLHFSVLVGPAQLLDRDLSWRAESREDRDRGRGCQPRQRHGKPAFRPPLPPPDPPPIHPPILLGGLYQSASIFSASFFRAWKRNGKSTSLNS